MRYATAFVTALLVVIQALGTTAKDCRMYMTYGNMAVIRKDANIGSPVEFELPELGYKIKIRVLEGCKYEVLEGKEVPGYPIHGKSGSKLDDPR